MTTTITDYIFPIQSMKQCQNIIKLLHLKSISLEKH